MPTKKGNVITANHPWINICDISKSGTDMANFGVGFGFGMTLGFINKSHKGVDSFDGLLVIKPGTFLGFWYIMDDVCVIKTKIISK